MANPEHLKVLKQGVKTFNKWRIENPNIEPNLIEANLYKVDLSEVNLRKANLKRANLSKAIFINADLSEANLYQATILDADFYIVNLRGADLRKAALNWTDFRGADLSKADFSEADLSVANFHLADLNETNFSHATIEYTIFGDTDLSKVIGLENMTHDGPSTIGIETIFRSGGKIPPKFLEDAGVPDILIKYMGSLTGQAIQFYSCFISHSTNDKEFANRLHADLRKEGVRCWFASENMKIGDEIRTAIDKAIRTRDKILLVLSENSINSEWVKDEVEAGYEEEKLRNQTVLFPIRTDHFVMVTEQAWAAKLRRQRNIGDFTNWKDHDSYQQAFKKLLKDLQATNQIIIKSSEAS
jgi:hypothetical protein